MKNSCSLELSPFVGAAEISFVSQPRLRGHLIVLEVGNHLSQLNKFIETFGKHINFLKIEVTGINSYRCYKLVFQRIIENCLAKCPNLKSLAFQTNYSNLKHFDAIAIPMCEPFERLIVPQNLDSFLLNI